jgi:hypothetical protein
VSRETGHGGQWPNDIFSMGHFYRGDDLCLLDVTILHHSHLPAIGGFFIVVRLEAVRVVSFALKVWRQPVTMTVTAGLSVVHMEMFL